MKYVDNENPMASMRFSCTQVSPNSLVYGTEDDLRKGLYSIETYAKPERVFVESNCSVSLVGDDVQGIADQMDIPWPVYAMDSGGMKGSFEAGYSAASLRIEKEMKTKEKIPASVNVLGLSTVHMKGREDAEEIRRLLSLCGIRVISMPGGGSSWEDIMDAPSASLNIVVRDELGLSLAKQMERDFGTPYMSCGLPYGTDGTLAWLSEIIEKLGAGELTRASHEAAKLKEFCFEKAIIWSLSGDRSGLMPSSFQRRRRKHLALLKRSAANGSIPRVFASMPSVRQRNQRRQRMRSVSS